MGVLAPYGKERISVSTFQWGWFQALRLMTQDVRGRYKA